MENDATKHQFSRRGFLGIGSAALAVAAGSMAVSGAMAQESKRPTGPSATDPSPANAPLDAQNPDSKSPLIPKTIRFVSAAKKGVQISLSR